MKCDIHEREEQAITRHLGGFYIDIFHLVQLQQYCSLDNVICMTMQVEKHLPTKFSYRNFSFNENSLHTQKTLIEQTIASNKLSPQSAKENHHKTLKCFKCQGIGHITSNFPTQRTITIIKRRSI